LFADNWYFKDILLYLMSQLDKAYFKVDAIFTIHIVK
jgi:hypothetical protein